MNEQKPKLGRRPKLTISQRRISHPLSVSVDEWARYVRAAAARDMSVSAYLRSLADDDIASRQARGELGL